MEDLAELEEFPYQGTRRPFDWFQKEEQIELFQVVGMQARNIEDALADLDIAMLIYMRNRKRFYINYMQGAKVLFHALLPPVTVTSYLKELSPHWNEDHTNHIRHCCARLSNPPGWSPHYEIQRLWIATGIHWSWLELSWIQCAAAMKSNTGVNIYAV